MKVFIFCFFLFGCNFGTSHQVIKLDRIEDVSSNILGKSIEEIKNGSFSLKNENLFVRDTLFIEEEKITWPGVIFSNKNGDVLFVETNWKDRQKVVQATVVSSEIETKNHVGVGASFSQIEPYIRFDSWKDFPDGYIMFKDSLDKKIVYSIGVDSDSFLYSSALSLSSFPDTVRVQYVILR